MLFQRLGITFNVYGEDQGADRVIRFYLDEEPILKNVPTWQCRKPTDLQYVLEDDRC